jgi:glutamate---cysteine ligase / carboxylate-amine ligase
MGERKIGIEEEFLLVDPRSRAPIGISHRLLADRAHDAADDPPSGDDTAIDQELFLQQIETGTDARPQLGDVETAVRRARRALAESAAAVGARVVASGTPVVGRPPDDVTPKPRYELIVDEFGEVGRQAGVCGMHVHVDVSGDEEGVAVLDYLRPWLPVLRAVAANSPYWLGRDTGYASWRSMVWNRFPTAGPAEPYQTVDNYRTVSALLIGAGAALDEGMLYLDARLSAQYPTIEVRVTDVCTELDDIVLVAGLTRALVETGGREWAAGEPREHLRSDLLRAAHWRSARFGVSDRLLNPATSRLEPARAVVEAALVRVREATDDAGDTEQLAECAERLFARGSGASRQRAVAEAGGSLEAVVDDLVDRLTRSTRNRR